MPSLGGRFVLETASGSSKPAPKQSDTAESAVTVTSFASATFTAGTVYILYGMHNALA